ncbi:unnamed protein product [Durusdinium trenchii]|uniref:Uncharacterized protein n=1 Tax=Durusdinium trenchii TaxID=1381693 RepID=A0ABP0P2S8_9DINO
MKAMGSPTKEEMAKKRIEEELAEKAPGSVKPFFACCGGPVGTMEKCICIVPPDQREQAGSVYNNDLMFCLQRAASVLVMFGLFLVLSLI